MTISKTPFFILRSASLRGGGRVNFETVHFQNGTQSKQNCQFVINQQECDVSWEAPRVTRVRTSAGDLL